MNTYKEISAELLRVKTDLDSVNAALNVTRQRARELGRLSLARKEMALSGAADRALGRFSPRSDSFEVLPPDDSALAEVTAEEQGLIARATSLKNEMTVLAGRAVVAKKEAMAGITAEAVSRYREAAAALTTAYSDLRALETAQSAAEHFAILGGGASRLFVPGLSSYMSFNGSLPGCDPTEIDYPAGMQRMGAVIKEKLDE